MHYEALPQESVLSQPMVTFTKKYASNGGHGFTGDLSFDFMIEERIPDDFRDITLYPIECNPRAHTAIALFGGTPDLIDSYLSVLNDRSNIDGSRLVKQRRNHKYDWVGHDLVTLVILPSMACVMLNI